MKHTILEWWQWCEDTISSPTKLERQKRSQGDSGSDDSNNDDVRDTHIFTYIVRCKLDIPERRSPFQLWWSSWSPRGAPDGLIMWNACHMSTTTSHPPLCPTISKFKYPNCWFPSQLLPMPLICLNGFNRWPPLSRRSTWTPRINVPNRWSPLFYLFYQQGSK